MHFDTALNLVWLALGILALANTIRLAVVPASSDRKGPAWLHVVGVALIIAALFPYISATDDVLRINNFNSQQSHQHPGKQSRTDNLIRLYEAMDTPLVSHVCQVALTLLFAWLVFTPSISVFERIAPLRAGRSPPHIVAA